MRPFRKAAAMNAINEAKKYLWTCTKALKEASPEDYDSVIASALVTTSLLGTQLRAAEKYIEEIEE